MKLVKSPEHGDEKNSKLIQQLKRHEGLMLKPYLCTAGKCTIGFGRNLESRGITEDEAAYLLVNDVEDIRLHLENVIPEFNKTDDVRKDVLINMAFNIGVSGLMKFKNMLYFLGKGDHESAATEMLDSHWSRQVHGRANELAGQMRTGKYQE